MKIHHTVAAPAKAVDAVEISVSMSYRENLLLRELLKDFMRTTLHEGELAFALQARLHDAADLTVHPDPDASDSRATFTLQ